MSSCEVTTAMRTICLAALVLVLLSWAEVECQQPIRGQHSDSGPMRGRALVSRRVVAGQVVRQGPAAARFRALVRRKIKKIVKSKADSVRAPGNTTTTTGTKLDMFNR